MNMNAVEKVKDKANGTKINSMRGMLERHKPEIEKALPRHFSPERMVRIANTCLSTTPKLAECDPLSFFAAIIQASQLGLEPNVEGQCYILPYWNKKLGCRVAQFQIGYRGLVELFWRHEKAESLTAGVVHKKDVDDGSFNYDLGTGEIHHTPDIFSDRGPAVAYYVVIAVKGGGRIPKIMSKDEVLKHAKQHSKSWDAKKKQFEGPWKTDFDSMALKTVFKQAMKWAPKSVEMQHALASDETTKLGIKKDMLQIPDETDWEGKKAIEEEKKELPQDSELKDNSDSSAGKISESHAKQLRKMASGAGKDEGWLVDRVEGKELTEITMSEYQLIMKELAESMDAA